MANIYKYLLFWLCFSVVFHNVSRAEDLPPGVPDPGVLRTIFSGEEQLQYVVSWTGGIKIGDLSLRIKRGENRGYEIHARVTDYGAFRFFYPVDDTFTTYVRGKLKLPYRYDVLQKEGRGSVTKRLTRYDQRGRQVTYQRDNEAEKIFAIDGPVHNEFSSFYATRAINLSPETAFMVPTFADEKRNKVKVQVSEPNEIDTVLGRVVVKRVMPIMKFKGLYDKAGDTVIWITDDACRVPVKINSKILIGSLTATLVSYINPMCDIY